MIRGEKISRGLGLKANTKIRNVHQNIGLVLVFKGQSCKRRCLKFVKELREGSNGDRIIFKHCKHKINLRQHND